MIEAFVVVRLDIPNTTDAASWGMPLAHNTRAQSTIMRSFPLLPPRGATSAPAGPVPTISLPAAIMNQPLNRFLLAAPSFALVALLLQGCGVPTSTVDLTPGPDQVEFTLTPTVIQSGATALVKVVSPSADSISIESPNGSDR